MTAIAIDPTPFYETRLILLMETSPQSNQYRQILLKADAFSKVSGALAETLATPENPEALNLTVDDEQFYTLQTEIKSIAS